MNTTIDIDRASSLLGGRRLILAGAAVLAAAAFAGVASAADGSRPIHGGPRIVGDPIPGGVALRSEGVRFAPGRLLVRFRAGTRTSVRSAALEAAGVSDSIASYDLVPGLELVKLAPGHSVPAATAALASNPNVFYATPDYELEPTVVPNDPRFGQLWGMTAIGMPTAWDRTTGSPLVTVAILDTGMDLSHPDLAGNLWQNVGEIANNNIDDDLNGFVDDVHGWDFRNGDNDPSDEVGHGTHVAGTIGAIGNNSIGVVGVNWSVRLMPLKICAQTCDLSAEIAALDYAADEGAKVVNSSFGGVHPEVQAERDVIEAAGAAGIIDVAAAGNNSSDNDLDPFYPASYPLDNVISVAATTDLGELASFSNFGVGSVDLGAPGQGILSTYPTGSGSYSTLSGTSMASPHVAGAAALLWAQNPAWTRQQVRNRLIATVSPLSALAGTVASCGQLDLATATDPLVGDRALVCAKRTGTGSGSVSSSPAGIACGGTCVAAFTPTSSVTLTATPTGGSTFVGWRGPCSGTGTCTVTANGATTAIAVFRRSGSPSGWNQSVLQRPAARDPFLPNYGRALTFYNVSLSETGNVRARTIFNPGPANGAVVNCNYDTSDTGGVYLSRKTASGWVDEGVLTAPAVGADAAARWANCFLFGSVTEVSGDGNRVLVSQDMAHPPSPTNTYRCAAFVFVHNPGGWAHEATLLPPGIGPTGSETYDGCGYFGIGGAISRDGSRVAVLGWSGHVYVDVFVRGLGGWTHEGRLDTPVCGDAIAPPYLALSADGSRALVSDPWCDTGTPYLGGRVYAFTRSGSTWTQTQTLNPPENRDRLHFGSTVAMSADGKTAAISSELGPAYVYERGGANWTMVRKLDVGTDSTLLCPAVVRTGARVLCSAYETVGFNRAQGALYSFDRATGGWGAASPTTQRAFASDGLANDLLSRVGSFGWASFGVTESGTFIDATMSAANIALGYYPHDRIGYEFVTPDPLGKLVPAPTQARASSTGNALTFTYTAATALSGGTLSLTVPAGWSAPSTTPADPGFTTASQGSRSISGRTITVSGLTLAKGQTFTVVFGSKASGGPGATAPPSGGDQTWPASVRVASTEPLVSLVAPPVVRVLSPDGSGTTTSSPTSVPHGATGKTITFTYTAAPGGLSGGTVTLEVPTGWSAPSTTGTSPGFTKTSAGTLSISSRTVTVSGLNLSSGQKVVFTYGAKTSGGPGATAPSTTGAQTWTAAERSSSGGTLANLASPPSINIS
jgi:subtilisin family serine protease